MHRRPSHRRLATVATFVTLVASAGLATVTTAASIPPGSGNPPPATGEPAPDTTPEPPPATEVPATEPTEPTAPPQTAAPATTEARPPAPTQAAPPAAPETTEVVDTPTPLRILLTNDDGWDAEGITAVHEALVAAGHDVVVVAPATNQSGTGARVTFVGELTLTQHAEAVYSVNGSPADATELGLDIAFGGDAPDLVLSGSNAGQNIGAIAVHSGTIGAAVTALNEGVPAIAVSTEEDLATGEGDFAGTAAFVVAVVGALADQAGDGPVLPDGIGLNVNFPLVEGGDDPAGVVVTTTDSGFVDLDYSAVSIPEVGAETQIAPGFTIEEPIDPGSDVAQLAADFVTVTFITNDYDVIPPAAADAVDELGQLLVDLAL